MFKWFHKDKADKPATTVHTESAAQTPQEYVDPAMAWAAALGDRVAHFEAPEEQQSAEEVAAAWAVAFGERKAQVEAPVEPPPTVEVAAEIVTAAQTEAPTIIESLAVEEGVVPVPVAAAEPAMAPVAEAAIVAEARMPARELPPAVLATPSQPVLMPVHEAPAPASADQSHGLHVAAASDRGPYPEATGPVEAAAPSSFNVEAPSPEAAKPRTLRERLAATARALTASVGSLFKRNPKLDEDLLEELETALIQADVGVMASSELVAKLGARMRKREFADAQALLAALRSDLRALVANYARPLNIPASPRPFVILTVGINGAGKTTTIGKLAMRYKQAGYSVMLAAGDTFRAAAVEQLKTWGDRNQVTVISQGSGADSASVIFDAFQAAKSRNIDVLIADTAGRLHTQGHLMQELAKVKRVLGKIDPSAPHETLLVIDGGTGQNALNQAKQFHQSVGLNGIVVTKLDGTAKGGMVFALCRELGLPIRFIGVGEKREDLREFVAEDFVEALLPRELG